MLPNIQSLKDEIQRAIERYVAIESRRKCGFLGTVPMHVIHEGGGMQVTREDGSSECNELQRVSAEIQLHLKDTGALTDEARHARLDQLTSEMAAQMSAHFFRTMDQSLEEAGQVVDGKNLSPIEAVFAMFEKVEIGFNEDGGPTTVIIAGKEVKAKLEEVQQQINADPELRARWDDLMERKRGAWHARETSRKLVR